MRRLVISFTITIDDINSSNPPLYFRPSQDLAVEGGMEISHFDSAPVGTVWPRLQHRRRGVLLPVDDFTLVYSMTEEIWDDEKLLTQNDEDCILGRHHI